MIQDIHPHLFDNTFTDCTSIQKNDYIFFFKENELLLKKNDADYDIPEADDFSSLPENGIFLFKLNDTNCFLIDECPEITSPAFSFEEISYVNTIEKKELVWMSVMALQLKNWYFNHKFCGKCGSPNHLKGDERALVCSNCHNTIYPNIAPAIIVAILSKDKILLAHNVNFREGFYSLIAGYLEVGETLEDCVKREVKEEIGIDVRNIRYYKSQPWPYSSSMMIGFIAEADDNQPIQIDQKEIMHADWYTRDNLPNHPPVRSIAGVMIEQFINGEL